MTPFEALQHPFLAQFGMQFIAPGVHVSDPSLPTLNEYDCTPNKQYKRASQLRSVQVLRCGGTGDLLRTLTEKSFMPIVVTPKNKPINRESDSDDQYLIRIVFFQLLFQDVVEY